MLGDVEEAGQWIDVVAGVVDLWEPRRETIAQVGLLGDESGRLESVNWESANTGGLVEMQWGPTPLVHEDESLF